MRRQKACGPLPIEENGPLDIDPAGRLEQHREAKQTTPKLQGANRAERRRQRAIGREARRPRNRRCATNRLHRAIENLIKSDGDFCTVCRARFEHNCRTFGGETAAGAAAVVGDCCVGKLRLIVTSGVYLARDYDFFPKPKGGGKSGACTIEQIEKAISATQQAVRDADQQIGDAARRGGVPKLNQINILDAAWKDADRAWFEQHPTRSHRIRPAHPGEAADVAWHTAPEGCVLVVVVRQVEPGLRIKQKFFFHEELWPAPDDETIAHALFDLNARGEPVGRDALQALAASYQLAAGGSTQ